MFARTKLVAASSALALAVSLVACGAAPSDEPAPEPADVIEDVELDEEDTGLDDAEGIADAGTDDAAQATQRIGTPDYGYVDVPADYIPFTDVAGGTDLQFSDVTGTSIFTLNTFDLSSLSEDERDAFTLYDAAQTLAGNNDQAADDVQGATVELCGRTAYQVYAWYEEDDTFLVAWVVDDPEGTIHYVCVEGPGDTILDNVELVEETYAFEG